MKKVLAIFIAMIMALSLSVSAFAEEIPLFSDPDGEDFLSAEHGDASAEGVYSFNPWDFFGVGGFWGRNAANVLNITIDEVKEIVEAGGATFTMVFGGTSFGEGIPSLTFDFSEPQAAAKFVITPNDDGTYTATASIDDLYSQWTTNGKSLDDIGNLLVQPNFSNFVLYEAYITTGDVAEYNGTKYASVTGAIDAAAAAAEGGTVTLIHDAEGTGFVIPENVTLDMNGYDYTITAADSSARITTAESIVVEGTLIIDGTVTATEGQPAITVKEGANVTIAEGAVVDGDIVFEVDADNIDTFFETTNIKVTGGEVNGNFPSVEDLVALYEPTKYETAVNVGLYVGGPGNDAHSDVSITGPGEYTLTTTNPGDSKDWVILKAVDGSGNTYNTEIAEGTKIVTTKMTINDTMDVIFKEDNTVETYAIGSNGVIEVIYHLFYGGPTDYITNMPEDLNKVTVNFTVDPDNYISDETLTTTIQNAVSVTGGKFSDSTDIQDYLSDGYTVDGSGNVIVAPTDPIAVINANGTTYYEDMETALANVQTGDTITLRNNVEVHKMVDITVSNVILDLGGFTLTAADDFSCTMGNKNDAHVINISANGVTVRNGTVKATANNKHAINVYQVDGAVLENVTADHTDSTTGAPIVIGGSDVTVKGRLTTITGMNSWYAINVDSYAGMESNITFAQNSTVAFEGVSPLGIYIETNSTADTDDVTVTFDKNVSVIAPEGVSDFTAVATDENATNASVVNPGNAGLKDNGDGTYGVAPIETSKKISGCIYLNEDYHALIVNGRFIVYPHADNGSGFCTACKGVIVADTAE